jgi:hypothetical protein
MVWVYISRRTLVETNLMDPKTIRVVSIFKAFGGIFFATKGPGSPVARTR